MIEIKGEGGESLLFDGASVAKFRHHGKEESARNPASTFREVRVSPRKQKRRERGQEQRYDVLLACSDGLWSGLSDDDMAEIAKPGKDKLVENLKALSIKALSVNSPYSDNTTGTALRWFGS